MRLAYFVRTAVRRTMSVPADKSVIVVDVVKSVIQAHVHLDNFARVEHVWPVAGQTVIVPLSTRASTDNVWIRASGRICAERTPSARSLIIVSFACVRTASKVNRPKSVCNLSARPTMIVIRTKSVLKDHAEINV